MTTGLERTIQTAILIAATLLTSACAALQTGDSIKNAETIASKTEETTRTTIEKGAFENPPEIIQLSRKATAVEPLTNTPQSAADHVQVSKPALTRITPKEPYVNIRTAPSLKSRNVAILKGGHSIEILETQDSWVKVSWHKGNSVKQGWMKKAFAEGYH